ncbi:hypothetical protein GCM10009733_020580 [Nonomuraea maheshkhaliensis]|uniref:Uncharacterized protein n=1 Tax=Nonomuraea maheshkhaliensis TaxID=419590 RepID=A0ABN2F1P7_9ACTN
MIPSTPATGTSRERMDEIWAEHRTAFRAALIQEVADIPGLTADFEHSHTLAWLAWEGDGTSGYWVGSSIAYHSHRYEHQLPGHVTATYLDASDEDIPLPSTTLLDFELPAGRARDAETAAALIVAAIRIHGRRRGFPQPFDPLDHALIFGFPYASNAGNPQRSQPPTGRLVRRPCPHLVVRAKGRRGPYPRRHLDPARHRGPRPHGGRLRPGRRARRRPPPRSEHVIPPAQKPDIRNPSVVIRILLG